MNTKWRAVLSAGLVAGALDITAAFAVYAWILNVTTVQKILQSVAAGVYGKQSNTGGWNTALCGLALHFLIALIFAAIFVLLYPALRKIAANKIVLGIIYGCLVWLAMNYVVLPLSAVGHSPKFNWKYTSISLAIIIVCVGIPIPLIVSKILNNPLRKII